ncbi:hypothetical protein ABGB12_06005 [Actinocorallia sp. B10E7]|uniref:hypothetical protein n=1 Tax=Actinocorallia sp. B10E7 TaxID=3153558 RepID=UPI00325D8691
MWSVIDESDRQQWDYVPMASVGPLRFGMSPQEARAVLEARGFTGSLSPLRPEHGALTRKAEFRDGTAPRFSVAVTLYYRDSEGLTCVAVDALCGPQVFLDGMRLVGRAPSELLDEFFDHMTRRGVPRTVSVEGDAASDELGIMIRAQRAGDILLTRAFFAQPEGWACTVHDCLPVPEGDIR